MLRCGLLGRKLGHSYSPEIHEMLGDYEYTLYEKEEYEIEGFLKNGSWTGLNVTIPYKKTVLPFMFSVSDAVNRTGSVNTIIRKPNGELFGDNTDVYGFIELVHHSRIQVENKKALVLGSGGASASVCAALEILGARPVIISRSGANNYGNIDLHGDADIIVNTTPLGMYPETGNAAVDLNRFPHCTGVIDIVYNPARTALLLQAEKLGIPFANGLYMLVAQAKRSSELFTGNSIPDKETERICKTLSASMQNIILIGMPGCGKSRIAAKLGRRTGREVLDSDLETENRTGFRPAQIIIEQGEQYFRDIECGILSDICKESKKIIATGGGAVLREENYASLHQNGIIVWIKRNIDLLPSDDRPLSQKRSINDLYSEREPLYRRFADVCVDNNENVDSAVEKILNLYKDSCAI